MRRLSFSFFSLWFLMLPFTVISSFYLGMTATDKLMAPMLILLWLLLLLAQQCHINREKLAYIGIAFAFFFLRNLSKIDNPTLYTSLLWEDSILLGYYCLPILYIDNIQRVQTAAKLISANAIVGCLSAFFVAMGWLTLPYERFSSSRFELAVQKSIGLFSSYGDLAQFVAYFMLLAFFVPASLFATHQRKGRMLIYLVAIAVIVIGIIGNQSRSLVLSLLAAIFMAKIFQYRTKSRTNRLAFNMLFISIATSAAAVATALLSRITTFLGRMGGGQAEQTAMSRLDQYQYALKVIDAYPILGAEGSYYRRFEIAIDGIHNMWLGQLARGGFASALLLFILLLIIFRASLKLLNDPHAKQYGLVAIGYMFALLAATLFYPANSALFWALLGTNTAILATLKSSSLHQ